MKSNGGLEGWVEQVPYCEVGFDLLYTFGSDNETSSLNCIIEMWEILRYTFILTFFGIVLSRQEIYETIA